MTRGVRGVRVGIIVALFAALLQLGLLPQASAAEATRYGGSDRYGTAVDISRKNWTAATTKFVYIARGDVSADALVAGTLRDGPILLTTPGAGLASVRGEITRLGNPPIVVIGGKSSVPDAIASYYSGGARFERLAGATRFEVSVAVSQRAFKTGAKSIYLTNGVGTDPRVGSPDGVVGGTLTDGPILLVNPSSGPTAAVTAEIARLKSTGATQVVKLGSGNLGIEAPVVVGGETRYHTAISIAKRAFTAPSTVYLARGDVFADAIAGGSLTDGPILLTQRDSLQADVCTYLRGVKPGRVVALGGTGSVSAAAMARAVECSKGTGPVPTPTPTRTGTPPPSFKPCGYDILDNPIDCSKTPTLSTVIGYWTINELCGVELNCFRGWTPQEAKLFGTVVPKAGDKFDPDTQGGYVTATKPTNKVYPVVAPDYFKVLNEYRAGKGIAPYLAVPGVSSKVAGYAVAGFGGHAQLWAEHLARRGIEFMTNEEAHSTSEQREGWWNENYPDADPGRMWVVGEVVAMNNMPQATVTSISQWDSSPGHKPSIMSSNLYWSVGIARNSAGTYWYVGQTQAVVNVSDWAGNHVFQPAN